MTSSQQNGVGAHLGHFPKRQKRRPTALARAGKRIAANGTKPLEVNLEIENVSRFRSAFFHVSLPFAR